MNIEEEKIKEICLADEINNEFGLEKNIDNIEELKINGDIMIIKSNIRKNIPNIIGLIKKIKGKKIKLKHCFKDIEDNKGTLSFIFTKSE